MDGLLALLIKYTLRVLVQYIHNPSSSNEHVDGVKSWPCEAAPLFVQANDEKGWMDFFSYVSTGGERLIISSGAPCPA